MKVNRLGSLGLNRNHCVLPVLPDIKVPLNIVLCRVHMDLVMLGSVKLVGLTAWVFALQKPLYVACFA